ncbi:MAG: hypothetical protein AAF449_23440, partial [Myxococcota bacterium]
LDNALQAIERLDPETLSIPARNMQRLLRMTPDTAVLSGTALEELVAVAPLIGLSPARVLADLLGIDVEDPILSAPIVSSTVLDSVIATHPRAQRRLGPRTADNPAGVYTVEPGTLPITLADAATNFAALAWRFGPTFEDGVYHPGFLVGDVRARVLAEDFMITVRANANALPFKGVDLTTGAAASVNSIPSQIGALFDFDDPNWLSIEGLVPGEPVIEEMTFQIVEDDRFHFGGRSPLPRARGASSAWMLAPYTLERVLIEGARRAFVDQNAQVSYRQPDRTDPLLLATVDAGWQQIDVLGGIGAPPPPSYLWDLIVEIGQVRVHDDGVAEGEGNVAFTLYDIPLGTSSAVIERTLRDNLAAEPFALLDLATTLIDSTVGEADFYYVRSASVQGRAEVADWLFFIDSNDIPRGDDGQPVRPYTYSNIGFYADSELSVRVSSLVQVDGDTVHHKVRIEADDALYVAGPDEAVYALRVEDKPSPARIGLAITRVR